MDNKTNIYDETCAGLIEEIESEFDSLYEDVMDILTIHKEGHGFRAVGGVRD